MLILYRPADTIILYRPADTFILYRPADTIILLTLKLNEDETPRKPPNLIIKFNRGQEDFKIIIHDVIDAKCDAVPTHLFDI